MGNSDHMTVFNVSAYMVHKPFLHTIHLLVKKVDWPSLPQRGGNYILFTESMQVSWKEKGMHNFLKER